MSTGAPREPVPDATALTGRDRAAVWTSVLLFLLAAAAWARVLLVPMGADDMAGMGMVMAPTVAEGVAYVVAWTIMMAAMMLPSAAPMVALYGAVHRHADRTGQSGVPTLLFALVYLIAWLLFGIPVYAAQFMVDRFAAASPMVAGLLPYALAIVLIAAGVYQFSPLKTACLRACQSPLGFLMARWRAGYAGTLRLGLAHAIYCIGCCWALMVVLVAAGAMGLHWVLLIAALVAAEKLFPGGIWIARTAGALLVVLGVLVAANPALYHQLRGGMT
jgi:predicted metal-binding membrane protein